MVEAAPVGVIRAIEEPSNPVIQPPAAAVVASGPPPAVVVVSGLAVALVMDVEPGWHQPADHHDPVASATEGVVVVLFFVAAGQVVTRWLRR